MNLIKLNAIDSTNSYLKGLSAKNEVPDCTIVMADYQTKGRGQMGTNWVSEEGKNLMFSLFKKIECLHSDEQFYISIATSLAIFKALKQFQIPELKIKWPNDILSANQKICGILIETIIKSNKIKAAIIGVGLNVNQTNFPGVINASSLKQITGILFDRDEILNRIISQIETHVNLVCKGKFRELRSEYEQYLFRKDKPSTFKNPEGELFMGYIKGITNKGLLNVMLEDNAVKEFDLKEIKLLY